MIVHPCDLSVKPLLSKGTKGNGEGGSNRDCGGCPQKGRRGGERFSMTPRYCKHWKALFPSIATCCVCCKQVYVSFFLMLLASKVPLQNQTKKFVKNEVWEVAASIFVSKRISWHVCTYPSHRAAKWLNGYFILFITQFFPTIIEVISGNYLCLIKAITGHMIEHLYTGRADIRSHSCFKQAIYHRHWNILHSWWYFCVS